MRRSRRRRVKFWLQAALYLGLYLAVICLSRHFGNSNLDSCLAGVVCCGFLGVYHVITHYVFYSKDWELHIRKEN
jgi:hypothetical protein